MKKKMFFITGEAGTGKTTMINEIISSSEEVVCPTATTGVAATHINGSTVHSVFACKPISEGDWQSRELQAGALSDGEKWFRKVKERLNKIDLLIIDEISMMSAENFENFSYFAQAARDNEEPFGGMKVIMVGDFLQLPPIAENNKTNWIFNSTVWKESVKVVHLKKVYRQKDGLFKKSLSKIRYGICDKETITLLSSRVNKKLEINIEPIKLCSRRDIAANYNQQGLDKIGSKAFSFVASVYGDNDALILKLKNACLAPEQLELKIGAQVMTLVNHKSGAYINGSMGTIVGFKDEVDGGKVPVVELLSSGKNVLVEKYTWKQESSSKVATYTQFPLMLAYGITIHKSQGMTLDAVEIDFKGIFAEGQAYVALSRARSIKDITIKNFDPYVIRANQEAVSFYKNLS